MLATIGMPHPPRRLGRQQADRRRPLEHLQVWARRRSVTTECSDRIVFRRAFDHDRRGGLLSIPVASGCRPSRHDEARLAIARVKLGVARQRLERARPESCVGIVEQCWASCGRTRHQCRGRRVGFALDRG
jgi:hypothetical protein